MGPTTNLLILNVMPFVYTHNCNASPNMNTLTILSVLETLEYVEFFQIIHIILRRIVTYPLIFIGKKDT